MTLNRRAARTSAAVVGGALAAALYLGGSPGEQRLVRMDDKRVRDLNVLANAVQFFWQEQGELPADLQTLLDGRRLNQLPVDPASGLGYGYAPATDSFELCATFDRASSDSSERYFWAHPAGEHCYAFDTSVIMPPGRMNAIGAMPLQRVPTSPR